jgi:hypothetical protein
VTIDFDHLLWRTRGARWDYTFLLRPAISEIDDWYDLHRQVFARSTPDREPTNIGGTLTAEGVSLCFAATCFLDPTRRDAAGRPIAHYLLWLEPPKEKERILLPRDWGRQLTTTLAPALDSVFELGSEQADGVDATVTEQTALLVATSLEGDPQPIALEAKVVLKKKSPTTPSSRSNPSLKIWLAVAALVLLIVVVLLTR